MTLSNQYPRLPWVLQPEATSRPSFVAYPVSPDGGWARVFHYGPAPEEHRWQWVVHWPGRFSRNGSLDNKQGAADKATIAFWDAMEETADWVPPPPPPPPRPRNIMVEHFWMRFDTWLYQKATREEALKQLHRYRHATIHGPSIIGRDEDRTILSRISQELWRLR